MSPTRLALATLAVWRLTHLLALEDGPFDAIVRLRRALDASSAGRLLDCFQCLSMWIAIPFALALAPGWTDRCLAWLGLSGAACLLERLGTPPVAIAALGEEDHDELLRSASHDDHDVVPH